MAVLNFLGGVKQLSDNNGAPLAGGKVYFFEPGTNTPKSSYTTSSLSVANSHPVVLDGNGRANIWISGPCDVEVHTSADVTVYTEDSINPDQAVQADSYNLITNGNFELNSVADGVTPDDWTLTVQGAATLDTSDQQSGQKSLSFTTTGSGGGSAQTTNFFAVSPLRNVRINWLLKSTAADVRVIVRLTWFDSSFLQISTTDIYDEQAAVPTSWTQIERKAAPPSTARYAKLTLIGGDPSNANSGTIRFDSVFALTERKTVFPVGMQVESFHSTAMEGFIFMVGQGIGPAGSGATLADDLYEDLFTHLWNNLADAEAPVSTGRGASAAADWAAGKTIIVPDFRGRVAMTKDNLGGSSANVVTSSQADTMGAAAGAESHILTEAQMPSHFHGYFQSSGGLSVTPGGTAINTAQSSANTVSAGGGQAHNNMQPYKTVARQIAY